MTKQELLTLISSMSLEEKAFQLSQVPATFYMKDGEITGTDVQNDLTERELALMGSTLSVYGSDQTRAVQEHCLAGHPHHIPMLFMMDVIHGYRTVFPTPLGTGAGFDPGSAEEMMSIAAKEASSEGIHVAFSPMLDLVRDPRWGRVMESPGEDPYLNGVLGRAMVRGLQGEGSKNQEALPSGQLSSCIKHFAGYGAPEGGRDYQNSELSEHTFREFYLPAYRAAIDEGADMVMSSFQTLNGVPSAANGWLLKDILRGEWGFDGVIITDWAAIDEMVQHGICSDLKEATLRAFNAGVDIDMCSMAYHRYLPELVREGRIAEADLDRSVMRVLQLKNRLGLFDNPYRDASSTEAARIILCPEHRRAARKAVCESLVLLKNEGGLLPLGSHTDTGRRTKAALIGPYLNSQELYSAWAPNGRSEDTVTVAMAARELTEYDFSYVDGCRMDTRQDLLAASRESSVELLRSGMFENAADSDELNEAGSEAAKMLQEAVLAAKEADVAILFLGEHRLMSGEGASRTDISIPARQLELLRRVYEVNRNIVTVVFSGRPLDLREVCKYSRGLVMAWLPGTEGGHGIMDVLTGKENFSGRLPMSIPVNVGQVPVYYNQLNTGRPKDPAADIPDYRSAYLDSPNRPLYPFGYGLSYSSFEISPVSLTEAGGEKPAEDKLLFTAAVTVKNTSDRTGTAVLQLYIRDDVACLARPCRELKDFRKVTLAPGEAQEVTFDITTRMLEFTGSDNTPIVEKGAFTIWIGENAETENGAHFTI